MTEKAVRQSRLETERPVRPRTEYYLHIPGHEREFVGATRLNTLVEVGIDALFHPKDQTRTERIRLLLTASYDATRPLNVSEAVTIAATIADAMGRHEGVTYTTRRVWPERTPRK